MLSLSSKKKNTISKKDTKKVNDLLNSLTLQLESLSVIDNHDSNEKNYKDKDHKDKDNKKDSKEKKSSKKYKLRSNKKICLSDNKSNRKISDKHFNKLVAIYYNIYLEPFKNNTHNQIYNLLQNIAKKKYYKDEKFAAFQEDFFQDFLRYSSPLYPAYDEKKHQKLLQLRSKANST